MLRINQGLNDSFSPFLIFLSPQRLTHRRAGIRLTHRIQMAINIRRRAHIRVPQPFLDLLHRHALGKQHRRARVPEIVEADLFQLELFQKLTEVVRDKVGIVQPTEGIHADVVGVFLRVRRAHRLLHPLLFLSVLQQFLPHEGFQRERAVGGFCLQPVFGDESFLGGVDGVADGQRVFREVDRRPLHANHLTSAQTVVRREEDGDVNFVIPGKIEQLLHLLGVVEAGDELLLLRAVCLIHGVRRDDAPLDGIDECLVQHAVIPLAGGALQICVAQESVKIIDLIARHGLHGKVQRREERAHVTVDVALVLMVGLPLDVVLMTLQPLLEVVDQVHVRKAIAFLLGVCHRFREVQVSCVVLIQYLIQAVLCLFFVALLGFKIQGMPLGFALAVGVRQIDDRIVFALVLCQSSCDSFHALAPFFLCICAEHKWMA